MNATDNEGETVLFQVVKRDHYKYAQLLIKLAADGAEVTGATVLTCAANTGAIGCLQELLHVGAPVNLPSRHGFNAPIFKDPVQQQIIVDETKRLLYAAGDEDYNGTFYSDSVLFNLPCHRLNLRRICRRLNRRRLMDLGLHSYLYGRVTRLGLPSMLASYLVYDIKLKIAEDCDRNRLK